MLLAAPELVITRVGGYGSQSGPSGPLAPGVGVSPQPTPRWLHDLHAAYGKILSVGLVLAASWWPRPHFLPHALLLRVGFLMFLFLSLAPGFRAFSTGLARSVWVVALGVWATLIYYLAGALFLCAYYTPAAGGVPWDLANTLGRPAWTPTVLGLGPD